MSVNFDNRTVTGFGEEWSRFDQSELDATERGRIFDSYFGIFPWETLPADAVGFDLGCGSGRWAQLVAPRVGTLVCVDASADALEVAKRNLSGNPNCDFVCASVESFQAPNGSMDFGYSLGVLHHIPNPFEGIKACVEKLKAGAPFLIYLYYAFDNQPGWFRVIWKASDILRSIVSALSEKPRNFACDVIAATVYFPLARTARMLEKLGMNVKSVPLSIYRDKTFYTMRTDALDRFGTPLEFRFTRSEIQSMLSEAGLEDIKFSESMPFWCAVGTRKAE